MANEKTINARLQQKHDIEAHWKLATNFIPKAGEIIVYDDLNKIKIGDGTTYVDKLPFTNGSVGEKHINGNSEVKGEIFNDYENNLAAGLYSHAEGYSTLAGGEKSHAEGSSTRAYGVSSHAEGSGTIAYGSDAHSEGTNTKAGGEASHAEGYNTKTATEFGFLMTNYEVVDFDEDEQGNHLCEVRITLSDLTDFKRNATLIFDTDSDLDTVQASSISIDYPKKAIRMAGQGSDATIMNNVVFEDLSRRFIYMLNQPSIGPVPRNGAPYAHAEGYETQALGEASHAGGLGTIASAEAQTAIGKYNAEDADALFIVGNGTDYGHRSNAFTVDKDGNVKVSGSLQAEVADFNNTVAFHDDVTMDNALEIRSFATVDEVIGYDGKSVVNVGYLNTQLDTLITIADIDTICGGNIVNASEVTF